MRNVHVFSVEEANALIPRLEMTIARMQRSALLLRSKLQESSDAEVPHGPTTAAELRAHPELGEYVDELARGVRTIERLGGQFKGLDLGLVDFPGELDGRSVLLCWQYGEKRIAYWHHADEGFAGRRPLSVNEPPHLQ